LAAKRAGIKTIMLSEENREHVAEIPAAHLKGIEFNYVKTMQEVLQFALGISNF